MTYEIQISLVALLPLIYLLSFPIGNFVLLKGINHFFGIFHSRVNFLRCYLCVVYATTALCFYGYLEVVRTFNFCEGEFTTFVVAGSPLIYFLVVPGLVYALLRALNHFFKFLDSEEKLLDIHMVVLFTVSLISFIAFFFVVRGLEFCA